MYFYKSSEHQFSRQYNHKSKFKRILYQYNNCITVKQNIDRIFQVLKPNMFKCFIFDSICNIIVYELKCIGDIETKI